MSDYPEPIFRDEPYTPGEVWEPRCPYCGWPNDLCQCEDEEYDDEEST